MRMSLRGEIHGEGCSGVRAVGMRGEGFGMSPHLILFPYSCLSNFHTFPYTPQLGILPGVKPHLKVYALPGQNGSTTMQVGFM